MSSEAEKKRQEEAARKDAERLALATEKKRQEEAAAKKEAERLALEAEKKRQEEAAKKEAERLALEAEKKRQEEAARKDAERLALASREETAGRSAAKKEAERLALEAEKKRQEEAAKKEAERLALEAEKKRQEEAARKDAERLALAAEKKRQEELTAPGPNAAGKAQATAKTDQQIVVPNILGPASAPETTLGPWVTGTLKPQGTAVQGEAATCGSAGICTFPCGADLSAQRQGRRRAHDSPTAGADGSKGGSRQGRSRGCFPPDARNRLLFSIGPRRGGRRKPPSSTSARARRAGSA